MALKRDRSTIRRVVALAAVVALGAAACSSDSDSDDSSGSDGSGGDKTIVIGSQDFAENQVLAEIYGQALEDADFVVQQRSGLGSRDILGPAIESDEINFVPDYVGAALSFYSDNSEQPTGDGEENRTKLAEVLDPKSIDVLDIAPAQDQNGFVVTESTASGDSLKTITDLVPVAPNFILGGPPDCPEREDCQKGLADVYGVDFKEFKALDAGGPLTLTALVGNEVQVGVLFTTNPKIKSENLVVLEDDQKIVPAENIVPIVRADANSDKLTSVVNDVSAKITTDDLIEMNQKVEVDQENAEDVAKKFLEDNNLI